MSKVRRKVKENKRWRRWMFQDGWEPAENVGDIV